MEIRTTSPWPRLTLHAQRSQHLLFLLEKKKMCGIPFIGPEARPGYQQNGKASPENHTDQHSHDGAGRHFYEVRWSASLSKTFHSQEEKNLNVFTEKELASKTLWKIITRLRRHRQQRLILGTRKRVVFICCLSAATPRVEKVRKGYLMIFFFFSEAGASPCHQDVVQRYNHSSLQL